MQISVLEVNAHEVLPNEKEYESINFFFNYITNENVRKRLENLL